jgi:hypothetical protein
MNQFCTSCGHPLQPDERFCGACGHEAGTPVPTATVAAGVPPPAAPAYPGPAGAAGPWTPGTGAPGAVAPGPPPSSGRGWWWVAIALVVAITAVLVVALVIWLRGRDDPAIVVVPAPITTVTTTSTTVASTTPPTTTAPTTAAPTTAAPPPFDPEPGATTGFFVPEEALADWAWSTGLNYQGECSSLSSTADYGSDPWCATLWEDRGGVLVYRVADFPGGDFAYWVLVGTGDEGWVVREAVDDQTGAPPF